MGVRNVIVQKRENLTAAKQYFIDTNDVRTLNIYISHAEVGSANFYVTDDPEQTDNITNVAGMLQKEWLPLEVTETGQSIINFGSDGNPTKIIIDCYFSRYLRIDLEATGSIMILVSMYTDDTGR